MLAFAGWELIVRAGTGTFPLLHDTDSNAGAPFVGLFSAIANNFTHLTPGIGNIDVWVLDFTGLAVFVIAALLSLRATTAPVHERLALVFFVLEAVSLSSFVWGGYVDLRSLDEVYLMSVVILLGARDAIFTPRRRRILASCIAPAVAVLAMRRIVIMLEGASASGAGRQ
jgi:hypothetical protein